MQTGHEHTWFVLTQKIIEKEFALSGSEQNPDITGRDMKRGAARAASAPGAPPPVQAFKEHGADFVVERDLAALVRGMNALTDEPLLDLAALEREIVARDREVVNPYAQGHAGRGDPRRPALPRRPRDADRRRRTASSTRRPGR